MRWDKLSERQIRKAEAEGQLDHLKGAGKPLKPESGESADAAGYRIMAEAGVLPREIQLRKERDALLEQIRAAEDDAARKALQKTLADVQLRLDIEQEARRKYMRQE